MTDKIELETENFHAIRTPKGYKIFQNGFVAAKLVATIETVDALPRAIQEMKRRENLLIAKTANTGRIVT